jgi:hypothetical protein
VADCDDTGDEMAEAWLDGSVQTLEGPSVSSLEVVHLLDDGEVRDIEIWNH